MTPSALTHFTMILLVLIITLITALLLLTAVVVISLRTFTGPTKKFSFFELP